MLPRRIASRYAEALFELAQQQGKTDTWERELATLASVITATPDLTAVLTHPEVPLKQKEALLTRAFQGRVSQEILATLFMLIRRGHDPDMNTLHDVFIERWNKARQIIPVQVVSAVPLTETQVSTLEQVLRQRTGSTVQISRNTDPDLIAGMVVTIGDRVIDASTRTTLEQLSASMRG